MKDHVRICTLVLTLLVAIGCATGTPDDDPTAPGEGLTAAEQSERLAEIAADYWDHLIGTSVPLRLERGLPIEELPDLSYAKSEREAIFAERLLERLEPVDPEALAHDDWLTHSILVWQLEQNVEAPEHFWQFFQATPYSYSFTGVNEVFRSLPLEEDADLTSYLQLVGQLPRVARQLQGNLEERRRRGILVPTPEIPAVVGLMESQAVTGEASPFWVADERLDGFDEEAVTVFRDSLTEQIDERVGPAFEEVAGVFDEEYRKAAPQEVGIGQYPGGEEAYDHAVRRHTTLDLTPQQVHDRGLEAVERIEREMAVLRREIGFEGTREEFHDQLRDDERFLADSAEQVAEWLMEPIERLEPRVEEFFVATPEAPYGVERLDPRLEASLTFGYYQWPTPSNPVGRYLFNGSNLEERPLVNAAALITHELVPGHHFQIALQRENESLPRFRRVFFPTAFVEGWAEYASALADEMGLYEDPHAAYGRLAMDMFLSTRLIVDTGMNALGWSRERASEYMAARVLESETQIATETLRYAVDMPGQALAYKTGSATIWRLRRQAAEALGEKFDIRRFHDAVLGRGAMPLTVLEEHVEWWIARERARQTAAASPSPG